MPCLYLLAIILVAPSITFAAEELPLSLIRIPESVASVFVAETSTAEFHRFNRSGDAMVYSSSHYMSIGEAGVGKQRSGDRRTPLGVYFVTEKLDTSRLHQKYGVMAYSLDYPNAWDLRAGRSGDGIWVHGVDPRDGKRPVKDTDGCIVLQNDDLIMLAPEFRDNVTPVLVTQKIDWGVSNQITALRIELENAVAEWVGSKAAGDLHAYLSFYDEGFQHWGMDKAEWLSFSLQTVDFRSIDAISVNDLLLLGYPEEEGIYLSRFRQLVIAGDLETESTKRLYWRRNASGALKIIAEDEG